MESTRYAVDSTSMQTIPTGQRTLVIRRGMLDHSFLNMSVESIAANMMITAKLAR